MDLQRVGGSFNDLVDIRVIEINALDLARHPPCRLGKVADPPGHFALAEVVADGLLAVGLNPRRPEGIVNLDLSKWHSRQSAEFGRLSRAGRRSGDYDAGG